jgi:dTDP-4-amino-4,6-dideoxygalactose transaminase
MSSTHKVPRLMNKKLSLPKYAELSEKEIRFVCEKIKEFYDREK